MKNKLNSIGLLLITVVLSSSCWSQKVKNDKKEKKVNYQMAERYFIKNSIPDGNFIYKLSSQQEFESYFGEATVMGKNGKPTVIDFSTSFVIAVINEKSTNKVSFKSIGLTISKDGKLKLTYTKEVSEVSSSVTTRVPLIMIVSKKYNKELTANIVGNAISFKIADNYFVNNTVDNQLIYLPNISDDEQFNTYFGPAAVMGENGLPSDINFEKEYATAIIYPSTNELPNLKVESVTNNNGVITVLYSAKQVEPGEKWREGTILILDKKDVGKMEFIELKK